MAEQEQSTALALSPIQQAAFKEVDALGRMFNMETPGAILADVLASTAFSGDKLPTLEQLISLVVVARQYHLNPFTKEIYAFPDKKKGIVPIVGVDGWARIINEHPQFDGMEFRQSENMIVMEDGAKPAPEWMECIMHQKDRKHPTVIREFLDEVYRKKGNYDGPWQTHTKRFFRHKTMIQTARVAFGFAGIFDQDEGERIIEAQTIELEAKPEQRTGPARPKAKAKAKEPEQERQEQEQDARQEQAEQREMARGEDIIDADYESVDEMRDEATDRGEENTENHQQSEEKAEDARESENPILSKRESQEPDGDWQPQPGQASQGAIDFIRRKAEAKGYDAIDVCQKFGLNALRGMSEEKANEILQWVKTAEPKT